MGQTMGGRNSLTLPIEANIAILCRLSGTVFWTFSWKTSPYVSGVLFFLGLCATYRGSEPSNPFLIGCLRHVRRCYCWEMESDNQIWPRCICFPHPHIKTYPRLITMARAKRTCPCNSDTILSKFSIFKLTFSPSWHPWFILHPQLSCSSILSPSN